MIPFLVTFWKAVATLVTLFENEEGLDLDGTNQYVNVPDADDLSFGNGSTDSPFTLALWVKANWTAGGNTIRLMGKWDTSSINREYYFAAISSSVGRFLIFDESTNASIYETFNVPSDDEWHFMVATYDGTGSGGLNIYIDAVNANQGETTIGSYTAMENLGNPFTIGYIDLGDYPEMTIDSPSVWSTDLSAQEVRELMTLRDYSIHSQYANIISWWNAEEISGSTMPDKAGSNDASLINSPSTTTCIAHPYSYQLIDGLKTASAEYDNAVPYQQFGGFSWFGNGSNNQIDLAYPSTLGDEVYFDETWTISTWIKKTIGSGGSHGFIGNGSAVNDGWILGFSADTTLSLNIQNGTNRRKVSSYTTWIDDGRWHLVTIVSQGTSSATDFDIYLDNNSTPIISSSDSLPFASGAGGNVCNPSFTLLARGNGQNFDGEQADTTVFDKALSTSEIAEVYNKHLPRDEINNGDFTANVTHAWRPYASDLTTSGGVEDQVGSSNLTAVNMDSSDILKSYPRTTISLQNDEEGSYDFNGTNQLVNMGDIGNFGDGTTDSPFSLSVWVKPDTFLQDGIFHKANEYRVYTSAGGDIYWFLYDNNTSNYLRADTINSWGGGEWLNIVCTYDGSASTSGMKIYVNGVDESLTTATAGTYVAMHDTSSDFLLVSNPTSGTYYEGYECHASMWNKELSLCEAREIYNDGSPTDLNSHTASANLVSWWKMDGSDAGSTATDSAGSNNGTYTNSPTFDDEEYPTN